MERFDVPQCSGRRQPRKPFTRPTCFELVLLIVCVMLSILMVVAFNNDAMLFHQIDMVIKAFNGSLTNATNVVC